MIRRVRRQFICITMAMLTAVLLVPLIALNVVTEAMSYNQTRNLLEQIAISETTVPELPDDMPPDGKQPRQSTDTATETGTSAAETTAETTTETTATETAAAETTAKAAPAEQPKNPVQTQVPAVQSPVQTTAAPRTTAAPQTRATTAARTTSPRATKPAVTTAPPQTKPPQQTTQPDPDPPPWWGPDEPDHRWENEENYAAAKQGVFYAAPLAQLTQSMPMRQDDHGEPPFPDKKSGVVTIDHFLYRRGRTDPAGLCAAKGQGRRLVWEFAVFSPGLRHGNAGGVLRSERRTAAAAQGAAGEHSGVPADGRRGVCADYDSDETGDASHAGDL